MPPRAVQQIFFVASALALWGPIGEPRLLVLLVCYLAVWLCAQWSVVRTGLTRVGPRPLLWFSLALCVPGVVFGYRQRARLAENEGFVGLATHTLDRWRLSRAPVIAPPLVSADRPQTFFVHAPDTKQLRLRFGPAARVLNGEALGRGLFRIDYDPRRDGVPSPADGVLQASLTLDGRTQQRELRAVTPLPHPRWFCVSLDRRWAATPSEETDELIVFGPERRWSRRTVGDGPVDCAFTHDGQLVISHRYEKALWIVDPAHDAAPRKLEQDAALGRMAMNLEGNRLLVAVGGARPGALLLEGPEWHTRARIALPAMAEQLAFGPTGDGVVVTLRTDATIRFFERAGAEFHEASVLELGRPATSLGRAHDGQRIFVSTTDYRRDGKPQLGNHFVQDQILTIDVPSLRVLEQRLTARRSERQSKPGDVDQGGGPLGMHEARDGSQLIAFAGTDELWRSAASLSEPERFDLSETALRVPHGIAELADGTLLVSSPVDAAVGVIVPGHAGSLASAHVERVIQLAEPDAQLLKQNSAALARRIGERGFYESTRSGISCQSCHMHVDSDLAGYNLGDRRIVPTLPVAGLLGTAPYLRDGSYPRIRDLDDVAQQLYRGYLRDQPGRRATLEAFIESLPRARVDASTRDPAAERRGYVAFSKGHCDRCHAPPAFTNLGQLAMRALFPSAAAALPAGEMLDVPSLLSVAVSAPYLNDGRAKTLADVLEAQNPDNLHGDTRQLSASERRDLIAFLSSL